jgi:hypothetical protein
MRKLPIVAVLVLFGSTAIAQAGGPKAYIGVYGPDAPNGWSAQANVRPVRNAFANVRCAEIAQTYWTDLMPAGSYLNLR